jgi:hypothetical protein
MHDTEVRPDLDFDDIPMILTGIISTMYFKPSAADWQRHLSSCSPGFAPSRDRNRRANGRLRASGSGMPWDPL